MQFSRIIYFEKRNIFVDQNGQNYHFHHCKFICDTYVGPLMSSSPGDMGEEEPMVQGDSVDCEQNIQSEAIQKLATGVNSKTPITQREGGPNNLSMSTPLSGNELASAIALLDDTIVSYVTQVM